MKDVKAMVVESAKSLATWLRHYVLVETLIEGYC